MAEECKPVQVSRRIEVPPARIFEILANPQRHTDFDGSGMLRGAVSKNLITGVGDIFSMKMFFEPFGDYVMMNHVVQYETDRCIAWEPAPGDAASTQGGAFTIGVPAGHRWVFDLTPDGAEATIVTETYDCAAAPEQLRLAVRNGEAWIDAMTTSSALLDALSSKQRNQ